MKIRKLAAVFLCVILFCVAGCGNSVAYDDVAVNDSSGTSGTVEKGNVVSKDNSNSSKKISKDVIKVGVVHITDPAEGSGYTYTHDLGIQGMQDNLGLRDNQIVRKINVSDTDDTAIEKALQECVNEGCNIIFTTSWGYMQKTAEFAEKYPNIYFSHGTGYMSNGKNFNNYFGRIYQPRYLSGIAAGLKTQSNKIGYVAAMDSANSEVTGGIDAFALGVYSVNPNAAIYVKVTNSWYDPAGEEAAANKLLDLGCDVMTQHCDTPYPQTLAQERGVWGVGYNSDMSKETPDSALCSVIWNWSAYYTSAVQSLIDGTWDGSNYYGGISEGLVQLTPLSDLNDPSAQQKIDEVQAKMIKGEFNVFDGVLETNDGKTIGTAGETLSDSEITGNINWYYKNVTVVE